MAKCDPSDPYSSLRPHFIKYYFSWYFALLSLAGICGSILCIIVIVKHRVFAHGTRYWFITLSASDILTLAIPALDLYLHCMFENEYSSFHHNLGIFGCELRFAAIQFLGWTGNILQAGLSIERTVSIVDPIKSRLLFTTKRTKYLITFLITMTCAYSFTINILTFQNVNSSCTVISYGNNSNKITDIVYSIDLIAFRAIPFTVMLISSIVIVVLMRLHSKRRHRMAAKHLANSKSTQKKSREFKMSVLLISMNVATLVTNPLFLIFELFDGAGSEGENYGKLTKNICISDFLVILFNSFIYLNNQTNWIFYVSIGTKFQHYFFVILKRLVPCINGTKDENRSEDKQSIVQSTIQAQKFSVTILQSDTDVMDNGSDERKSNCFQKKGGSGEGGTAVDKNSKPKGKDKTSSSPNKSNDYETEIVALIHTAL